MREGSSPSPRASLRKKEIFMMKKSDKRALGYITLVTFFMFAYFTFYTNVTDMTIEQVENYRIISTE